MATRAAQPPYPTLEPQPPSNQCVTEIIGAVQSTALLVWVTAEVKGPDKLLVLPGCTKLSGNTPNDTILAYTRQVRCLTRISVLTSLARKNRQCCGEILKVNQLYRGESKPHIGNSQSVLVVLRCLRRGLRPFVQSFIHKFLVHYCVSTSTMNGSMLGEHSRMYVVRYVDRDIVLCDTLLFIGKVKRAHRPPSKCRGAPLASYSRYHNCKPVLHFFPLRAFVNTKPSSTSTKPQLNVPTGALGFRVGLVESGLPDIWTVVLGRIYASIVLL
ncbi:hypothetical protein PM082_024022 [Marasmius tenuissimus]|nr:hypothetical protein PM082_024022 [Marasmius tenuissimus]